MSTATIRLDPPIPLETPRGQALAHFLMDGGMEVEEQWLCVCTDGRWVRFTNSDVRGCTNFTIGRNSPEKPKQWDHFKGWKPSADEVLDALNLPGSLIVVDDDLQPIPTYGLKVSNK